MVLMPSAAAQRLSDAAELYRGLGWSVIPLHTHGDLAKVPAVPWKTYQSHYASPAEREGWFLRHHFTGLGIVTGTLSRLIVLDFDTPALRAAFERHCPNLIHTRIHQSRRGQHLLFQLEIGQRVPSRKIDGADLLSDGRYVVVPPTVIDGHEYRIVRGGQPHLLTTADVRQILQFFDHYAQQDGQGSQPPLPEPVRDRLTLARLMVAPLMVAPLTVAPLTVAPAVTAPQPDPITELLNGLTDLSVLVQAPAVPKPTFADLRRLYDSLLSTHLRNGALFRTACFARDAGLTEREVTSALAAHHAAQLPRRQHRPERYEQRHREALATIRSAFSRPPRPRHTPIQGLYNSIREALFSRRETHTVRVLEGLRLRGVRPGMGFTTRDAVRLLSGIVGRDSVYAALSTTGSQGQPLFSQVNPPPGPPPL